MKTRNVIAGAICASLVATVVFVAIPNFHAQRRAEGIIAGLQHLRPDAVLLAARAFARERKFAGDMVPLREMVSAGYLRADDVRGLEDQEVAVSLTLKETDPNAVLIRVRSEAGPGIVLLLDGSVQQVPTL